MRNFLQHLKSAISGAIIALTLVAVPALAVGPAATPPGGNVDANFSSVTAGLGKFTGGYVGVNASGKAAGGVFNSSDGDGIQSKGNGVGGVFDGFIGIESKGISTGGIFSATGGTKVILSNGDDAIMATGRIRQVGGIEIDKDGSISAIDSSPKPVKFTGDIEAGGKIKAKSIGRIYTNKGSDTIVAAGGYTSVYAGCDSFSHKRISCSFTSTGSDTVQADTGALGADFSCSLYVKNMSTTASSTVNALATCFDPNG